MPKKYKKLLKRIKRLEKRLTHLEAAGQELSRKLKRRGISATPVEVALAYANQKLGYDLCEQVPGFETRYANLQSLISMHGERERRHMPVIHWREVKRLQRALLDGHLDIHPPHNEHIVSLTGRHPTQFDHQALAERWRTSGLRNGARHDDKVKAELVRVAVSELTPIQAEIFFKKVIKKYRKHGLPGRGSVIHEKPLVISGDNDIIDGHHRFAAFYLVDPDIEVVALRVDIRADRLLRISRAYGESLVK
ncbi:MAG: hypothetical protein OQL11_13355 [Gammaproteobacteria bacterium]|nr:hypothetical protein [Gammaproteobacteria bacterium]